MLPLVLNLAAAYAPAAMAQATPAAPAAVPAAAPPAAPEMKFTIKTFTILGDNPIGEEAAQAALKPYLGEQTGIDGLQRAAQALEEALRTQGHGLYRVTLPPQEAVDTITMQIVAFPITAVAVTGRKYFDEPNIRASLPSLQEGKSPNMKDVARELSVANENPGKRTVLKVRENDDGNGIAADIEVADSNPWSFIAALNNSGSSDTGRTRLVTVLQNANVFNMDHVASLAYTTSPDNVSKVSQYGLYYRVPFYRTGGSISASYSYSSVNSGALGSGQEITGKGTTAGIAYTQNFYPVGDYRSTLTVGLDDKLFKAASVGGVVLSTGDVRSRPLSLEYGLRYDPDWGGGTLTISYARNLSSGSSNTDAQYAANRAGASSKWDALRFAVSLVRRYENGWILNANARGQYASDPLVSGEQFGLGGAASIRGISERALSGDSGASATVEAWTPEVATNLRLLGFVDTGFLTRHQPPAGTTGREDITSVGMGLRYTISQQGSLSVDYGYVVNGTTFPGIGTGTNHFHANFLYKF